jgi:hypothetical protein
VAVRPCFFVVEDGGTFWRLKKRTFERILLQHDDEVHPEFAGQRVKYATIYVDYDGRRPVFVRSASFGHIKFDKTGRLDAKEDERYQQLFIQKFPDLDELLKPHLTAARVARVDEQIEREFGWQPTPELRDQLYEAALHNRLVGGPRH